MLRGWIFLNLVVVAAGCQTAPARTDASTRDTAPVFETTPPDNGNQGFETPPPDVADAGTGTEPPHVDAIADTVTDATIDAARDVSASTSPALKLVTFNIRYANAGDGVNAWPNRRDMVYRLMRELDADVAGLQEALVAQLLDLDAALPEYRRIGVGRDDGRTAGEFSPILYRPARFDVESSGNFWFSDTPEVPGSTSWGNVTTRICTWGRFVEKGTGRAYYHYNVHLDNVSQLSREKSVALLMRRIAARPVATDPYIVTGDFNAGESDAAIRFVKGTLALEGVSNPLPMVDSFRQLYPNATAVGTFHNFLGGSDGAKIDFIFTRPADKTIAAAIILKQENGRFPSDHFPVTTTVELGGW